VPLESATAAILTQMADLGAPEFAQLPVAETCTPRRSRRPLKLSCIALKTSLWRALQGVFRCASIRWASTAVRGMTVFSSRNRRV
jgi:hypothetical protein